MAGSVYRSEPETLRNVANIRRTSKPSEAPNSAAGFAQLLSAADIEATQKLQVADETPTASETDKPKDQNSDKPHSSDERAKTDEAETADPLDASALMAAPLVDANKNVAVADAPEADAAELEGVEADADSTFDTESPIDTTVSEPEVAAEAAVEVDVAAEDGAPLTPRTETESRPATEVTKTTQPRTAPTATVATPVEAAPTVFVASDPVEPAPLAAKPVVSAEPVVSTEPTVAKPDVRADAPAADIPQSPVEVLDVNLAEDAEAPNAIEPLPEESPLGEASDLALEATDATVPDDGGEIRVAAAPGAANPAAIGARGGEGVAVSATVGGQSAGQQGSTGQQQSGTNSSSTAALDAAIAREGRAARVQAQQGTQFSKALQDRQLDVVRQVAKQIGLRGAASADQRISLLLRPESLGAVRLDLTFDADRTLSVDAIVEQSATRRLLAGAAEELRLALRNENFTLTKLTVSEDPQSLASRQGGGNAFLADGGAAQGGQSQARSGRGGNGREAAPALASASKVEAERNESSDGRPLRLGDVDLTA